MNNGFENFLFRQPAETVKEALTTKAAKEILHQPADNPSLAAVESFLFPYLGKAYTEKHLAGGKYDHDQSSHGRRGSAAGGGKRSSAGEDKKKPAAAGGKADPNDEAAARKTYGDGAVNAAKKKLSQAVATEKKTTPMMTSLAEKHGGAMEGLQHRMKTIGSLSRKTKQDSDDEGISVEDAAAKINDAVRYTMTFDNPATFVENVKKVQSDMKAQGWERFDHKYKNFFEPGGPYRGYNTVLVNKKTGEKFELQFHTKQSLAIKHKVHKIYEVWRKLPNGDPQRDVLYAQMVDMWKPLETPAGWESLEA